MAKTKGLEKPMRFKDVQEYLGAGSDYVYKALEGGRLKGYKLGNRWIVYPSDLQKFMDSRPSNQKKVKLAK